jgi:AraC-like DNA-binding protein
MFREMRRKEQIWFLIRAISIKIILKSYVILNREGVSYMNNNTVVEKIVDYIETHINEDLPLDKIANALNYSKFYIARIFTEETKCTVYKYIQGRRLTLAAQKLVETEQPIVEIAYEAHYDSQQAFTLAFKQLYECTPNIYRKNGVFHPKQSKICMMGSFNGYSFMYYLAGGQLAA